jgi:hypothetical protein
MRMSLQELHVYHTFTDLTTNKMTGNHITKSIHSDIDIQGQPSRIWDNITNVKLKQFSDPLLFKLLDIPKPLRAEIISAGEGGSRIAYFDTGKRFCAKDFNLETTKGIFIFI